MRKIIVVAMREYQAAVRTKAFLFSLIAMPIFMFGSVFVQRLLKDKVDVSDKKFAVLDGTGQLYETLVAAAGRRNENEIFKEEEGRRKQIKPRFLLEKAEVLATDREDASLELSEGVRESEIFGFLIIDPAAIQPPSGTPGSGLAPIAYYSNAPTYDDFEEWADAVLNNRIRELRARGANLDPEQIQRLTARVSVANLGLVSRDETGQVTPAKATNKIANFFVPFGMMMLMFMVVMIGASPLMQSVLEEKMQRIAEVLLGSLTPFQLMMGKLLGMVGVSLTVVSIYLVGGYYAISKAGFGEFFPRQVVWWFVIFQAMSVLMYGSLFCAIGAAVSDMKEAQNLMTPVMLIVMIPMFVWFNVVREPNSTLSLALSMFPPATPMLMTLRQAVPPGIPLWQPVVGVAIVVVTTLGCVFVAGRIFRVGILMQGKGANIAQLLHWVLRG